MWRESNLPNHRGGGVKDWVKVVLELALVLLKVSREVVGLIKDIKNLRCFRWTLPGKGAME